MKLTTLLNESSSQYFDAEYTDKFRDEVTDELNALLKAQAVHGFKVSEYTDDADSDTFGVTLSNKLFDLMIEIQIRAGRRGVGSEAYDFYFQLAINDDYAVENGRTLPTEITSGSWSDLLDEAALNTHIKRASVNIDKLVKPLIDWYFDINGSYGKVKMFVEKRGAENMVRALAGDFFIPRFTGEVY